MSTLVCGLDVHKDSTYATLLNSEGKIVNQTRMKSERVLSATPALGGGLLVLWAKLQKLVLFALELLV